MKTIPTLSQALKLVGTLLALALCTNPLTAGMEVGAPLPALAEYGLEGASLPTLTGKVVVVDFWASWCGPCLLSFPALQEIQKHYTDAPVVILAVSVDEKKEDKERFLKKIKFTPAFTIMHDAQKKMVQTFAPGTMPSSYIFDKTGKLRFVHTGFHGAKSRDEFIKNIDQLLKE
ncbi:MAG: TlpA disulfide reductase family protein [Verrucomicrobiota bacterium]|nr:TlpA disulfide reductase family protein [Verrucomicrobiota bacterium]